MPLVEVAERTWRLGSDYGGRDLFQYLIVGDERCLLVDAGLSRTPRETILPALRDLAIEPSCVEWVVVTHPDLDHQGGLAALMDVLPLSTSACGVADRPMVEDPHRLIADRYEAYAADHGLAYEPSERLAMLADAGAPVTIGLGLVGREVIELGGRRVQVLNAPGHSTGHLVLHELSTGLLFSSDAVQGKMCPDKEGECALPPTYEEVDAYLGTIEMLETLAPSEIHSGHWPAKADADVVAFLQESREFVFAADEVIRTRLSRPATARDLCEEVEHEIGPFGCDTTNLMFAVCGHLRRLQRVGCVKVQIDTRPLVYVSVDLDT